MWGNFYSVSSEHDNSEIVKACYDVEPRQRDMRFDDVYNVLKSDKPLLPSEAAPLFGPSKKWKDQNKQMEVYGTYFMDCCAAVRCIGERLEILAYIC